MDAQQQLRELAAKFKTLTVTMKFGREMNSALWTWFAIGYMTLWAYVVSFMTYQIGLYFTTDTIGGGQILAGLLAVLVIIQAVRPNPHKPRQ